MDAAVREFVRERAGNRCEYCLLKQEYLPFSTFQVEHIIPRKHGGNDAPANLALACDRCTSHKGTNLTGIDPKRVRSSRSSTHGSTPGKNTSSCAT